MPLQEVILKHQSTIYEKSEDEDGTKIPVNSYYNYEACKTSKYQIQCTSNLQIIELYKNEDQN